MGETLGHPERRTLMVTYNVVLFVHIVGVATLFAAFGAMQIGGSRVRHAQSVEQAGLWLGLLRVAGSLFGVAFLLILAAGLYMTVDVWTFSTPWVDVALVGVGIMIVLGGGVVARGLGKMGAAVAAADPGPLSQRLRDVIADPVIWASNFMAMGIAVGNLWLMTNKPGWVESVIVVVALALIGAGLGLAASRRSAAAAVS
jgi:hypothetical protein